MFTIFPLISSCCSFSFTFLLFLSPILPPSLLTVVIRVNNRRQEKARPLQQTEEQQHVRGHRVHSDKERVSLLYLAGDVFSRLVQQGGMAEDEGEEVGEDDAGDDDEEGIALQGRKEGGREGGNKCQYAQLSNPMWW